MRLSAGPIIPASWSGQPNLPGGGHEGLSTDGHVPTLRATGLGHLRPLRPALRGRASDKVRSAFWDTSTAATRARSVDRYSADRSPAGYSGVFLSAGELTVAPRQPGIMCERRTMGDAGAVPSSTRSGCPKARTNCSSALLFACALWCSLRCAGPYGFASRLSPGPSGAVCTELRASLGSDY